MPRKAICTLAAAAAFVVIATSGTHAGKEVFQPCKPHCNVGTAIGDAGA